jgi:hypothetical protein
MVAVELPLTPFFFEKLGIFQELTDKRLVRDKHLWGIEKSLLKWTLTGHQHLSTPIDIIRNRKPIIDIKSYAYNDNWFS